MIEVKLEFVHRRGGDPTDEATRIGPMSSAAQRDRVYGYLRTGVEEGAVVAFGGPEAGGLPERGAYVPPTREA